MSLRLEFSETGGYDCMFGAWDIILYDGDKRVRTLVSIDQGNYGQPSCEYDYRSEEAETVAHIVFLALQPMY